MMRIFRAGIAVQASAQNVQVAERRQVRSPGIRRGGCRYEDALRGAALLVAVAVLGLWAPLAHAQGSRHDDIVFGPGGHPVAGATVRVCTPSATGTPCSPLATIYTDATLTVPAMNPFQADGIGNYHFYAPAGRYMVQISSAQITGTVTNRDVILPADLSSSGSGNNISAFGLTLGGNLTVSGNATINGTLTTSNFSPTTLSPGTLNVTGNESVAGPRPRVDVTAYGAKGDNTADDTAAIQAAINAACAGTYGGTVFFPPGTYEVSQPQTPSTAPVFNLPCQGLHFLGTGTERSGGSPFPRAPFSWIVMGRPGASPNAAPVFFLGSGTQGTTFENLAIQGRNQAVSIFASGLITLKGVCLSTAPSPTGQADNVPLKVTNIIWIWMYGGCLQSASNTLPTALFTGETPIGGDSALVGLVRMEDVITSGGGFQYIQRANTTGVGPGNFVFRNVLQENTAQDFFAITATGGANLPLFSSMTFDHAEQSDTGLTTNAVISLNNSATTLSGVTINHSLGGNGGVSGPAIRITAGSLNDYSVTGCISVCSFTVVDGSGNPVAGGSRQNYNGFDYVTDTSNTDNGNGRLVTSYFDIEGNDDGTSARFFKSGSAYASLGIDPVGGLMFANPATNGFNAQVSQSSAPNIDIAFATALPPSGVASTATTGGTLAAGTYYYYVAASTASNCSTASALSAPSVISSGVTVGGANNAVSVTWTASPGTGTTPILGYCVFRSTIAGINKFSNTSAFISGASTTSFTDTGFTGGLNAFFTSTMQAQHRFTPTSLGVNTTSPQFNLDVNGSAAVNSLNGVQKAERFSGSDAAAKINACLTAASTSSGACDARGLTGTLTATSHIAIPAATTLLWGPAQLTVTDATTHDAIELLGDGSSLIGQQESGLGTVPRPDTSGYIACGGTGCTTVDNPNAATRNVDWVHIQAMYLQATGASSVVLNMTSVGHADIENNRFVLGTGGNSYGIFGNTSTGNLDSTNTLIKHNEFDPQSTGDTCAYLAGVFNVVVLEQNSCYLAPGAGQGFVLAKDSNGNYPNNDEFYGNDCETASTAFNQICYNIIGAQSVVIGPNNRCENVYNCFQFPADGSAVGIHLLDPYISLSSHTVVKPNEPSTSMVAIDNNGHNWLPSMHFGLNDTAGPNLLNNSAFEGWSNSTTLYYWGGVSGTNINQAGSGIYSQNASSGSPAADSFTQGTNNVAIGDNATAGLGINSGCIQVDATMNYTLAFRVAAASTGIAFRPGFRFYSDANCTEGNRITSASSNARVLTPANYAGDSNTAINGANWQSTNASLTYNNGITCNCNVSGADWNVATANLWTASRNYAITFRVPNAYALSSTIAHSMRVFILENTAANPNKIYVDDITLSQGSASPNIPQPASLSSTNPTVYGNLTVAGNLTVGALPATLTSGSPTAGNCAAFASTTTNVQDAGSPCPALFTKYAMGFVTGGQAPSSTNAINTSVIYLPNIQFSKIAVDVSTTDSSTSDFYSWAITDASGNVKCSVTAVNITAGGASDQSCTQGTVTLAGGAYIFAFTGNATTGKIAYSGTAPLALSSATSSSTSSSGAMTFPISIPSAGVTYSGYGMPAIILH
ncbi:MAG TPA: glycosyl hydrolase family 28-related protein [Candidatus Acidoferrales bacterium]|nr:glycosyl hydrolase family 28-related protein [Candidatus Acidoferrales bacterium]